MGKEQKTGSKLRIVWLCHFSNQLIQQYLQPRVKIQDYSPWISNLITVFEDNDEIELHIVAPYIYIMHSKTFVHNNIHYHFFNSGIPILGRNFPRWFNWSFWTKYKSNRRKITAIINTINPDLIHLHGAENAYFTSAILDLYERFPVFTTLQGFLCSCDTGNDKILNYRAKIEMEIYHKLKHFGVRTKTMSEYMLSINPDAVLHWHQYNIPDLPWRCNNPIYDVVYFARISKVKGIEDLLQAIAIVKKVKPDVSLLICGDVSKDYKFELEKTITSLCLSDNVTWVEYFKIHTELFEKVSRAKISVLPTHRDIIPGTIIESMLMELPVITYKAGSIPELNLNGENVLMHDIGDINGIANSIIYLLNDEAKRKLLAKKGRTRVLELWSNKSVYEDIVNAYKLVRIDFKQSEKDLK